MTVLAAETVGEPAVNIAIFLGFVALTLVIVYRASRNNKTAADYYAAGRNFTGPQNGIAISGDYLSAASFLGIAGAIALNGYDGFLFSIGFLIYGPIMIIGLHALDLVPKKAAGTAAGFTGFFGYVFGSAIAGSGVGWIADHFGWAGVFVTMVACCVLTIAFTALTLGDKRTESGARRA